MSPKACRLCQIFCVEVTSAPMLMPVRLPLNPPLAAIALIVDQELNLMLMPVCQINYLNNNILCKNQILLNQELTNGLSDAEGESD